jgi:hypothetical protein
LYIAVKKELYKLNPEELMIKIEWVREKMISSGMTHGFNSPETIKISQTLDKLLNKLMR